MPDPNPILVEVVRGDDVESIHRGAACVVSAAGKVLRSWGDVAREICPRSAIKPLQAIPLVESGAADAFGLSDEEIALACASHSGEPQHVTRIAAWLRRLGLSEQDLECGVHPPTGTEAYEALLRAGEQPTALHHNCSGKHTGFLTVAKHLRAPTKGYTSPDHPTQRAVVDILAEFTDRDADSFHVVRDGCSAVNVYMPLADLAKAWARLGASTSHSTTRIVTAMKAHPALTSGDGRPAATLIASMASRGIAKNGAEGVFAATIPDQSIGVAVKIDDGAGRAALVALAALLQTLGAFSSSAEDTVRALITPKITAWAGAVTGCIRPNKGWLG